MQKGNENVNRYLCAHLKTEFSHRLLKNSRYSMRAFARDLEIDPSTLSKAFANRRSFSDELIVKIANKIGLDLEIEFDNKLSSDNHNYELIAADSFAIIADWYHFAILDLTLLENFKSSPAWIARKLGISIQVAEEAIDRLVRMGFLLREGQSLSKAKPFYTNMKPGVYTSAHLEYQRQVLKKALEAIDHCPKEHKEISSMTIAADPKRLDAAREKIKKFRRRLCTFLEGGNRTSVYHLGVQLYPVTELTE